MAINDIVQTIAEARVDARSLSEFVFKPADFTVTRRLAPSVRTLQFYINRFNSLNGDFSSSVSVALSSLNSSVAEADGKVAYIETTVQDAINNTAVEGGVLADTFVTATANGVGTVARTQRSKNSDYVTFEDFGGNGNSVFDNTLVFNTALSSPDVDIIWLNSGEYVVSDIVIGSNKKIMGNKGAILKVSGSIIIDGVENVEIEGVVFKYVSSNQMVSINNSDGVTIKDCVLNGLGYGSFSTKAGAGIKADNSSNLRFSRNTVSGTKFGKGIELDGCTDSWITENYVYDITRAGISVTRNNTNTWVLNNKVRLSNLNFTSPDGAIDIYGANNINTHIEGNVVSEYGSAGLKAVGIRIKGSVDTKCIGNTIYTGTDGYACLIVQNRDGIVDNGVIIDSNTFFYKEGSSTTFMLRVLEGNNINITNNIFQADDTVTVNASSVIEIDGLPKNINVNSNSIMTVSGGKFPANVGVISRSEGVITGLKITGNTIFTTGRPVTATKLNLFSIKENTLHGSSEYTIQLSDSSVGFFEKNIFLSTLTPTRIFGLTNVVTSGNITINPDGTVVGTTS